jgi:mRNA-degrading endonuclease YafQ of YafQ-DinJ toxin-antitoxin module
METNETLKPYSKDFKFTLKSKEGKILLQSIVTFGTEEQPFPENWKDDYFAQISVLDYKQKFIDENFDIDINEDTNFDI